MAKTDTSKDEYLENLEKMANESEEPKVVDGIRQVKGKTENHRKYIELINEKPIVLCYGPPGSAKTSLACGVAANLVQSGKFERIVLTRPIVESGEKMGYLPGDQNEKFYPYLVPLLEEFKNYVPSELFRKWQHNNPKILDAIPLGHSQGRNYHNSIIIVDEAANCTVEQLKMIITRLGNNSKIIINGDLKQTFLPQWQKGGFWSIINKLRDSKHVGIIKFHKEDVVRSGVLKDILELLEE